ncbi:hypothetical protein SAMN04489712_10653 [Thermomonospora echinospora]|uniref:Uncharacterized protein n=1 Tax=Thermomonospora echinospora TaxID=1992 RepID=A0A1H6AWR5_9ACTN|nr:hypothetical protein SAMN04489712_10653 [Thermomonospora echinospora]
MPTHSYHVESKSVIKIGVPTWRALAVHGRWADVQKQNVRFLNISRKGE